MHGRDMTARAAEIRKGIAATDFSRSRNCKLDRHTIDRLITILERLDTSVEVELTVTPRPVAALAQPALAP